VSSFDHVTSPPTSTVTIYGKKHVSVSSHPGTDVPCGVLTITGSAYAGLIPKNKLNTATRITKYEVLNIIFSEIFLLNRSVIFNVT